VATEKVGVYRKYHGPIPKDKTGRELPKSEWARKRPFRWSVRWFGEDGKRYSRSFKTRKEAMRYAEEKQSDVRDGKGDPPANMSLKEFAKMYLDLRSDLSPGTRVEHARTLRFLQERLGKKSVRLITPIEARSFISWFRRRKRKDVRVSAATVNKTIRECRRIFREAVDCGLIRSNPFEGIRQEKVAGTGWHHVTASEYRRLIEACPDLRWRGMVCLAYCCGVRLGEVLNLTWADVDLEAKMLRVVRKRGEAGTSDWSPKDKDMRTVPLPKEAVSILLELKASAEEGQVYVLVGIKAPGKGKQLKRQNTWRDFQAIRRRAGVPRCSLHDLRRSYCTNLASSVPMHIVQELAGHSDIRTTRQYYVKVRPELLDKARKAVDDLTGHEHETRPD